jgi:hypothetical protein
MKKIHVNQKVAASSRAGGVGPGQYSMDQALNKENQKDPAQMRMGMALGHIQLHNFIRAIEMVMNDVKLDPYILVSKLLTTYYSGFEKISYSDFKKFFVRFQSYFLEQDVKLFLMEVKLLCRRDELIEINEIASMIRNDIEMMPK